MLFTHLVSNAACADESGGIGTSAGAVGAMAGGGATGGAEDGCAGICCADTAMEKTAAIRVAAVGRGLKRKCMTPSIDHLRPILKAWLSQSRVRPQNHGDIPCEPVRVATFRLNAGIDPPFPEGEGPKPLHHPGPAFKEI
ncbi:hypothetical protein GCM10007897_17880 [Sphingobium jiangsuense]|nr:hypothetical protein GCM10007897_17880 [Sphingobium jiangsuense]